MHCLVAVTGSQRSLPKIISRLKWRLTRRGFRVQSLKDPQQAVSPSSDIILVPCPMQEVDRLAEQIERKWTEQWQDWFAANKRSTKRVA